MMVARQCRVEIYVRTSGGQSDILQMVSGKKKSFILLAWSHDIAIETLPFGVSEKA